MDSSQTKYLMVLLWFGTSQIYTYCLINDKIVQYFNSKLNLSKCLNKCNKTDSVSHINNYLSNVQLFWLNLYV